MHTPRIIVSDLTDKQFQQYLRDTEAARQQQACIDRMFAEMYPEDAS